MRLALGQSELVAPFPWRQRSQRRRVTATDQRLTDLLEAFRELRHLETDPSALVNRWTLREQPGPSDHQHDEEQRRPAEHDGRPHHECSPSSRIVLAQDREEAQLERVQAFGLRPLRFEPQPREHPLLLPLEPRRFRGGLRRRLDLQSRF